MEEEESKLDAVESNAVAVADGAKEVGTSGPQDGGEAGRRGDDEGPATTTSSTTAIIMPAESSREDKGEEEEEEEEEEEAVPRPSVCAWVRRAYSTHMFLVHVVLAIALARAVPFVGLALAPEITKAIAVGIIFFFTGLGLKTKEVVKAVAQLRFNALVQVGNLGCLPVAAWAVARFLGSVGAISRPLADGMIICAALPMTVNMCIVLTKSAGGDEAAAVNNAVIGNLLGVVVTPLWVVALLGRSASVDFADVIFKLAIRVLVPFAVGQAVQFHVAVVGAWAKRHKPQLKRLQESLLVFLVFLVFCATFADGLGVSAADVAVMVVVQIALLTLAMAAAWFALAATFAHQLRLRVAGLFCITHKTIAMGVPLIDAIFADARYDDKRAYYLLPLLVWHPAQLIIGSALTTTLAKWVANQEEVPPHEKSAPDDTASPA